MISLGYVDFRQKSFQFCTPRLKTRQPVLPYFGCCCRRILTCAFRALLSCSPKEKKCTIWFVKLKKGVPSSRFGDEVSNPYFCHFYFDVSGHCIFTFVNGLRRRRPRGRVFITCLFAGGFCQKGRELVFFFVSDLFLTHPPPPLHQTKFRVSLGNIWPSFFWVNDCSRNAVTALAAQPQGPLTKIY